MEAGNKGDAMFQIFICGDFIDETARDIIMNKEVKLPEGAVLLWRKEASLTHDDDAFKDDLYIRKLCTLQFGRHILCSPCLPSTHTVISQNFHFFPVGTVCVADIQLFGKGRAGNVWESPKGCLMFSFSLEMDDGRLLPFLQYVASIALIDAIECNCLEKNLPTLPVKIKWPNDIYANGMKVGGVLSTSTYRERKFNVVIGIGLNIGNREPTTCLDVLIHDIVPGSPPFQREELLAIFFQKFEQHFNTFVKEGFAPLENSYYKKWLHSGQVVTLEEMDDGMNKTVPLVIQGLTSTGFLHGVDVQGESYELHPDGNSLDFFKGLIRTKIPS